MKKFGLFSLVLAGVAFTAVGCASEAGLHASGSTQASATPETTTNAAAQADASTQTQPVQAPQVVSESAPAQ